MSESDSTERSSRIPGFYRMDLDERLRALVDRGFLDEGDADFLRNRAGGLGFAIADKMSENVIGVLELPLGLALNFVVDGRDYVVPMAIEEPSVVAAASHVAKLVRESGGFTTESSTPVMIGQIQVVGCDDWDNARRAVEAAGADLAEKANAVDPALVERGGGVVGLETRVVEGGEYRTMLVVHVHVDCVDAMGANAVNTMAETIAPDIEGLTGGRVYLRILSNLADRRTVRASCNIPFEHLTWHGFDGARVAEGVEIASEFASIDPYRAATHNKGIMNGVSAVCVATGNDWRAIEAGAHAFACRDGRYGPLATWRVDGDALVGQLEIPGVVGIVGGPIKVHPTVQLAHRMLGVESADELARVVAAVGLAQNLGALKALATEGIQRGHMSLHARTVAVTAGATAEELDACVEKILERGDVRVDRAVEILREMRSDGVT